MIAKKNSRFDLERKRTALFAMGLLTATSFTLAAFTYDSPLKVENDKMAQNHSDINYVIDNLTQKEKEPEVETETDVQHEDTDQSEASVDASANPDENSSESSNTNKETDSNIGMDNLGYNFGDDIPAFDELEDEIVDWVDKEAEYVGGYNAMSVFISNKVVYPQEAIELGLQGKVQVSFVIEKDGSITHVFVEKGICRSLDREAKRIVGSFPNWMPGELNAREVRTRVRLPIVFTLD